MNRGFSLRRASLGTHLAWHVIDAELSESVQAPCVHVPIRVLRAGEW